MKLFLREVHPRSSFQLLVETHQCNVRFRDAIETYLRKQLLLLVWLRTSWNVLRSAYWKNCCIACGAVEFRNNPITRCRY